VKHLLDTNGCVEYLRRGEATPFAMRLAAAPPDSVVVCSIVVGELLYGAERSSDPAGTANKVRAFCHRFISLPFDGAAAEQYAVVRARLAASGTPIGPNDLLIASIALANRLTLVTHNTREFARIAGLQLEDWQI
jgi:tRNA(fMet)-specific endonuclease VapC